MREQESCVESRLQALRPAVHPLSAFISAPTIKGVLGGAGWENRAEVLIVSQLNKWSSLESVANVVSSKKKKKANN